MNTGCRDCRAGLEHCHGTLIRHPLRHSECTECGCPAPEWLPHACVIDCAAIDCGCFDASAVAV
ncbi:hypothetical protein [Mycobacterium sp.]|uniref:hypothetical protein n=1 Tax=Mycobacterium sp. TaxID=1785 RepID=UPI0025F7AB63|nr:hypothetical protein [Mycobacterium sp.]